MKTVNKTFVSSIVAIVVCLCLIAGATYAWFVSSNSTNIAVTSGKVEIEAKIDDTSLVLYSLVNGIQTKLDEDTIESLQLEENTFVTGGTASIDEKGRLSLDRIVPGDKVEFKIDITNKSDIGIRYRVKIGALDSEFAQELAIAIVKDGQDITDQWSPVVLSDEAISSATVSVELPEQANNEHQDYDEVIIEFAVEAIQANAKVNVIQADGSNIGTAMQTGVDPYVELTGDITKASHWVQITANQTSQTVDFNNHTYTLTNSGATGFRVGFYNKNETEQDSTLTAYTHDAHIYLRNGTIDSSSYGLTIAGHPASLYDKLSDSEKEQVAHLTVHLDNMIIKSGTSGAAFSINANHRGITVIANNCTFENADENSAAAYLPADCNYVFNNCKFVGRSALVLRSGNVTLNDCTIEALDIEGYWDIEAGGVYPSGTFGANGSAIQIVNGFDEYKDLHLTVNGGKIISAVGYAIEEFTLPISASSSSIPNCRLVSLTIENVTVNVADDRKPAKLTSGHDNHSNWILPEGWLD